MHADVVDKEEGDLEMSFDDEPVPQPQSQAPERVQEYRYVDSINGVVINVVPSVGLRLLAQRKRQAGIQSVDVETVVQKFEELTWNVVFGPTPTQGDLDAQASSGGRPKKRSVFGRDLAELREEQVSCFVVNIEQ